MSNWQPSGMSPKNGASLVEASIEEMWGKRCSEHDPACLTCQAWAEYDAMKGTHAGRLPLSPPLLHMGK